MPLTVRRHGLIVALPVVLLIGWLDYVTGPEIGMSLLYLIPISVMAFYAGRWPGLICALAGATCWLLADLNWRVDSAYGVSLWNGFTRLTIYTVTAWLVDRVQADRTRLRQLNDDLQHALERETSLARTDPVTFLPNSRAFLEHLRSDLTRFAQEHCEGALLFLDLDDFKSINDEYGHAAGDEVLGLVAAAVQRQVRGADVAARIGGDEFALLVWHPDQSGAETTRTKIEGAVRDIAARYPKARLGVSIGMARIDDDTRDPELIIKTADAAMYAIKTQRKAAQGEGAALPHGATSAQ